MSVYCKFGGGRGDTITKSQMRLAKPSAYACNGTGRDTYISLDNGGLYSVYEPAKAADLGTFSSKKI